MLKAKLLDYIAMDIKNSLEKYHETTRTKVDIKKIKESIDLIKKSGIDYEFRTTIIPIFHDKKEMEAIGKLIQETKNYNLQKFRPVCTLDPEFENIIPYNDSIIRNFAKIMKKYVANVKIRGL